MVERSLSEIAKEEQELVLEGMAEVARRSRVELIAQLAMWGYGVETLALAVQGQTQSVMPWDFVHGAVRLFREVERAVNMDGGLDAYVQGLEALPADPLAAVLDRA